MADVAAPVPLQQHHNATAFDCGTPALNDFLKLHALDKQKAMLSRSYVAMHGAQVAGYYTLAHVNILQAAAPLKLARGMPSSIPALLMARLAVDTAYHKQGLGRSLFTDAVRRVWAVMQSGAAPVRLFTVDAKDDTAKTFYERFDMVAAPHNPLRLYLSYKTLRTIFTPSA